MADIKLKFWSDGTFDGMFDGPMVSIDHCVIYNRASTNADLAYKKGDVRRYYSLEYKNLKYGISIIQ